MAASSVVQFSRAGGANLTLTRMGFGGAPLGNMNRTLSDGDARKVVSAAWAAGLRYFDTAPDYGRGLSETRIGSVLRGKPRPSFVLSTKVGRVLSPCAEGEQNSGIYKDTPPLAAVFDYTYDGVMRSLEESLLRLKLDRVDILLVHDLDFATHGDDYERRLRELLDGGGWRALETLRSEGVVSAIGAGLNETASCLRILDVCDLDLLLLAGRYTMLEQAPLRDLLPLCVSRDVGVLIGGPFNSGILARRDGNFDYAPAPSAVLQRVEALRRVCLSYGVALADAALQFTLAHPAVVSVIPGAQTIDELTANAASLAHPAPPELWEALKNDNLIERDAPTPG